MVTNGHSREARAARLCAALTDGGAHAILRQDVPDNFDKHHQLLAADRPRLGLSLAPARPAGALPGSRRAATLARAAASLPRAPTKTVPAHPYRAASAAA